MGLAAITPPSLHLHGTSQHATPALTARPQLVKFHIPFNYLSKDWNNSESTLKSSDALHVGEHQTGASRSTKREGVASGRSFKVSMTVTLTLKPMVSPKLRDAVTEFFHTNFTSPPLGYKGENVELILDQDSQSWHTLPGSQDGQRETWSYQSDASIYIMYCLESQVCMNVGPTLGN